MKIWNVRVHKGGRSEWLGTVSAESEEIARLHALVQWGLSQEEVEELKKEGRDAEIERRICPNDDFDAS